MSYLRRWRGLTVAELPVGGHACGGDPRSSAGSPGTAARPSGNLCGGVGLDMTRAVLHTAPRLGAWLALLPGVVRA